MTQLLSTATYKKDFCPFGSANQKTPPLQSWLRVLASQNSMTICAMDSRPLATRNSAVSGTLSTLMESLMVNRLEALRQELNKLVSKGDRENICMYISHMYGVARFCTLLAMKRSLND